MKSSLEVEQAEVLTREIAPRVDVLKVMVSAIKMKDAIAALDGAIKSRHKLRGIFCNTHTIVEAQRMPELLDAVNQSALVAPDGMPLVWLCRLKGAKEVERVYGPDLMMEFCEHSSDLAYKHYFYGSQPETVETLIKNLLSRFPRMTIVGSFSPPFRPLTLEEDEEVIANINQLEPDVVWVGLGMPKQELWMADHQDRLNAPVMLGVGAAFDFHAGTVRQAPRWMQRHGIEWLFRLMQEPKRLWRRYLIGNTKFISYLLRDTVFRRNSGS